MSAFNGGLSVRTFGRVASRVYSIMWELMRCAGGITWGGEGCRNRLTPHRNRSRGMEDQRVRPWGLFASLKASC